MLPPDLVAKLNECAITNFSAARDAWFDKQTMWSGAVIVGLVLEGPEILYEMLGIAKKRLPRFLYELPDTLIEYAKIAAFAGWIFIIVGLLGEMKASSRIVDFSARIQECSDAKVRAATIEAGDAAKSAKTARDEADAAVKSASDARLESDAAAKLAGKAEGNAENVGKTAKEISAGLEAASRQLSQVEERVRVQGPRWKLLVDGERTFVEALKPFKGQKVTMVTCAPRQSTSQSDEEYGFELTLLNRLVEPRPGSVPGAGWTVGAGGSYSCKASGWGRGVWVMYHAPAVKEAAEALASALNKLEINADITQINALASEYALRKRRPDDLNALWEVVASDPTGIYVLTGENPQNFDPRTRK